MKKLNRFLRSRCLRFILSADFETRENDEFGPLRDALSVARSDLQDTYTNLDKAYREIERLNAMVSENSTHLKKQYSELEKAYQEIERLNAMVSENSTHLKKQYSELEKAYQEIERLNAMVSENSTQLKKQYSEIDHLKMQNKADAGSSMADLHEARNSLSEAWEELTDLRSKLVSSVDQRIHSASRTINRLVDQGKLGGGQALTFDDIVQRILPLGAETKSSLEMPPPFVFMHISKTAGTSVNANLMKNFAYRIDSYDQDFLLRTSPDEIAFLCNPEKVDDTRKPVFLTGHFAITNQIFSLMPATYCSITVLRDPIERLLSLWKFTENIEESLLGREIAESGIAIDEGMLADQEYFKFTYEYFIDQHPIDFFTRLSSIEEVVDAAVTKLTNDFSFFGLTKDLDEFFHCCSILFGFRWPLQGVRKNQRLGKALLTKKQRVDFEYKIRSNKQLSLKLRADELFYERAEKVYSERVFAIKDKLMERENIMSEALVGEVIASNHRWSRFFN